MGEGESAKPSSRRAAVRSADRDVSVDFETITDLIRLMDEHQLVEIEIERAGSKIRLVRNHAGRATEAARPSSTSPTPPAMSELPSTAQTKSRPIISPMIGTFYRSPSPDTPPFVGVGSIVEKGDTLCIIEAMKMMNEIEAEFRGRVTRVVADNGQTVEYGEELFLIEPL